MKIFIQNLNKFLLTALSFILITSNVNLYADDNLKAAKIDQIIDAASDITNLVSPTIREKDLDKKMTYLAEGMSSLAESINHVSNTTVPLAKVAFAASLLVENVQDNLDEQTKDIVKQLKD